MKKEERNELKSKRINVPHTCVIIFVIMIVCSILTYIVPSGVYTYVENSSGNMIIDPNSYTTVDASPTTLYELFNAIPTGLVDMASLIFFVFIAGGTFSIINETGTLQLAIDKVAYRLHNKEKMMVFLIMAVFSVLGSLMGFSTECIIFIPMGIALARKVGYDDIVGTAMILMGAYVGFACGSFNPYTTAVAQGIVGLPVFSGLAFRIVFHIVTLFVVYFYTIRYAERIKKEPSKSFVYNSRREEEKPDYKLEIPERFNVFNIMVLITMLLGFSMIIYGAVKLSWGTDKMTPILFAMGIISGVVGKLNPNKIAVSWLNGAKSMIFAGLVIGMGRGVLVIMKNGMIMDTLVHGMASILQKLPGSFTAVGMLICNIIINFFVPSGSGQATLVMPIMGPLAQICGISLQTAVLAFQCGDGFTNAVIPTSSVTTGCIGVANISFVEWVHFSFPIVAIEWGLSVVAILIAGVVGF